VPAIPPPEIRISRIVTHVAYIVRRCSTTQIHRENLSNDLVHLLSHVLFLMANPSSVS
jgi:hypothetical protein